MDVRQMRYFVAIVEHGSFSRAAAALNVAQPALSLHVRNMEADLKTPLLFRTSQGVQATEAGEILLRNARIIIDHFAVTQEEIRGRQTDPEGEVRLGLPGTISQMLAVPLILAAREKYPKIKLRIAEAMSGFVLEWITESRIDLAVLYIPIGDRALTSYPILTEELCLLGPAKSVSGIKPLPEEGECTYRQVSELPLILPSVSHGLRELLEREASRHSFTLNTVIDVDSYGNIKELVEKGLGYSILPYNSIAREIQDKRLAHWRIGKPRLTRDVYLAHAADRPLTRAVTAIEALCKDTLKGLAASGKWDGAHPVP